jgi:hypothetical protein
MKISDLVKMPEKKDNTYKQDYNGELQSEKFGYNQAIDEIGSMEVKVDREKLANLLFEKMCYDTGLGQDYLLKVADAIINNLPDLLEKET